MFSEVDVGKGLVKTKWSDIRHKVATVEPIFTRLVDALDPDEKFPIFLAYLPYGALKGDTISSFIPKEDGGFYRLSDPNAPKDVIKHLGYGKNSSPLGMVLDKELEYFIDIKEERLSLPWSVYYPGTFFPLSRILSKESGRVYAPNGMLTVSSGSRSSFMLPNIGCMTNYANLQREFNVQTPPPKSMYDHWFLFQEIINSPVVNCDWRSCLMYFSENWIEALFKDPSWMNLKLYLQELGWKNSEYQRNQFYYDIIFSIIQKRRNLKPNPYLVDTARYLFTMALGDAPGYAPATDENSLPLNALQKVFSESYGLKKYYPTIMKPTIFNFEKDKYPIYYSLQNPSTRSFSPKSRKDIRTLFELRELEHITRIFSEELTKDENMCVGTIMHEISSIVKFKFFHNEVDRHNIVKLSKEVQNYDSRFCFDEKNYADKFLASDAKFLRGCVSIYTDK